jgi:hypothetical protein
MKRRNAIAFLLGSVVTVSAFMVTQPAVAANAAEPITGSWEGPWYRGMTSGRVRIEFNDNSGTIQFTNLDNFGQAPRALDKVSTDGATVSFRAEGEKGSPLSANLKLNEAGSEMKGMGKFDGFPLRFEVKRKP